MDTNLKTSPRVSASRQRNRERMIQSILETSQAIMREQGVAALSMHELARRLEMRAPSLYYYFAGIMDIYDALFRLGFNLWGDYLREHTQAAETWQDEIRLVMEAYLNFALENPELFQLCFERPVPGFVPSEESLRLSFGLLEEAYGRAAGLKENIQTEMPPDQIADFVIAITHGITALHLANEPHLPPGKGRFGALLPAALTVLVKAWSKT